MSGRKRSVRFSGKKKQPRIFSDNERRGSLPVRRKEKKVSEIVLAGRRDGGEEAKRNLSYGDQYLPSGGQRIHKKHGEAA
ncbi:hypothetical protein Tco_0099884 [Tanacetum coccineum]